MNTQKTLSDVINPEEFFSRADNKTPSEIAKWEDFESDFEIITRDGWGFELLEDLIRCHRQGGRLDPRKNYRNSNLGDILCSCTPRLFEIVMPIIRSHPGVYAEFSLPINAAMALQFISQDEADDFISDYRLSAQDVVDARECSISMSLDTGPSEECVTRHLRREADDLLAREIALETKVADPQPEIG